MKILYIDRFIGDQNNGAKKVMNRNLRALQEIAGTENVLIHTLPKTNLKNVGLSILRLGSYGITRAEEEKIIREVEDLMPDFVFMESSAFGSLFKKLSKSKSQTILFAHNLDTALTRQYKGSFVGMIKYLFTRYNERISSKYCKYLICLTKRDSDGFKEEFGREADIILPITFPSRNLSTTKSADKPYFLFVGSDFPPNVEGIKWFIENVAPNVNANFRIVGGCCNNPELKSISIPENVKLVGYVEDIDKEYIDAAGVIAPIFKGSGMKTKTIEALSYGKSIYGTDEAFAGIVCDYSKIGALCNSAEQFVSALNSADNQTVNEYSLEVFSKDFSDSSFTNRLKNFLNNE